jgi:hypothetical protein
LRLVPAQEACALAGAAEMSAGNTAIPDVRASAAAAAISGRIRLIAVVLLLAVVP